jgi:hypothetical protein
MTEAAETPSGPAPLLVAEGLTKHFMVRGGALRLSHRTVKGPVREDDTVN